MGLSGGFAGAECPALSNPSTGIIILGSGVRVPLPLPELQLSASDRGNPIAGGRYAVVSTGQRIFLFKIVKARFADNPLTLLESAELRRDAFERTVRLEMAENVLHAGD
jgi:hypothetical protein